LTPFDCGFANRQPPNCLVPPSCPFRSPSPQSVCPAPRSFSRPSCLAHLSCTFVVSFPGQFLFPALHFPFSPLLHFDPNSPVKVFWRSGCVVVPPPFSSPPLSSTTGVFGFFFYLFLTTVCTLFCKDFQITFPLFLPPLPA